MSSVIFIGSPEITRKTVFKDLIKDLLLVSPYKVLFRILISFMPPFGKVYRKIYVDFLGPLLAFIILGIILNYGYFYKPNKLWIGPTEFLFFYALIVPIVYYMIMAFGHSSIQLLELMSLLGYALYGHIVSILISYICYHETSNFFFFLCLLIFGGSSTFRFVVVLLKTIPIPAARLIVCSVVAIVQILTLIFFHFGYMHKTFVYGKNKISS